MKVGDIHVHSLSAGTLRLDGGAMFGVVPRVLWEKKTSPDERHRILLDTRVLLVRSGNVNLLVDTGVGPKEDEKFRETYAVTPWRLVEALAERSLSPGDIQVVVNTHLHFDHAGGNTRLTEGGRVEPVFPNAVYVVQRREWEDARASHERNRASYLRWNYEPLFEEGRLRLVEGEEEVAPGVFLKPLPGHTLGMQGVLLCSRGETALYLGDLIPTHHHVPLPWIMAYDLHPTLTLETKRNLLPAAAREGWTLFFEHDPHVPAARLEETRPLVFSVHPVEG